jgi:hypothetical protein
MNDNAPNPEAVEALPGHEKLFQEVIDDIDQTLEVHLSTGNVNNKVLAQLRNVCSQLRDAIVLQNEISQTNLAIVLAQVLENRERLDALRGNNAELWGILSPQSRTH